MVQVVSHSVIVLGNEQRETFVILRRLVTGCVRVDHLCCLCCSP